jgi:hypothetical protein
VPVSDCAVGELDALLPNVSVELAVPEAFGMNVTVKGTDWPAGIVTGREIPESTNSLFVPLAVETVTDAPVAVKLPLSEVLAPTVTVPKFSVAGETDNDPCANPVPESGILNGEFEAFDTSERLPLIAPETVGANLTVKVTVWLAVSVIGTVSPLIEKPAPLTFACEIVMDELPALVSDSDKLELPPTGILPNERLAGLAERVDAVNVTVIAALADLVVSATLVAVSVAVVVLVTTGAVNSPALLTVPAVTDHVTAWLLLLITWAENCCVPPDGTVAVVGLTVTATAPAWVLNT